MHTYICIPASNTLSVAYFAGGVPAGFPSPAEEYAGDKLDINALLINNPPSTFIVRVAGDSMTGAGLLDGDFLVVDKSLNAKHRDIVIAFLNNEMMVKRLHMHGGVKLVSEHQDYAPIIVSQEAELSIWGVVTAVVRKFM